LGIPNEQESASDVPSASRARAIGGDAITGMRAANQLASGDRNRKCYDEADDAIISLREAERTAPQGVRKT
jgi:hypothetical protein